MNDQSGWERVYRLFADSVELEADAREALLTRLARTDPELVAEVRSLLSAHLDAGVFLEGSAIEDVAPTLAPGDRVGPYKIIEETGRGGMGVVFRAVRDDGDFTKEVAVKLIYPRLVSEENLRRFRAERQILALLDHPLIARLLDGGKTADGSPFLVMDFVAGRPLIDYCDAKRLSIDERLAIFLEVCDAVQFAHQRLVIHRDLKPDNILVNEDGSPRLLDFGIAKLLRSAEGASPATVTAPMNRVLTLEYASPEQIRGEPVTVATDVYSLGVILYELLSGARPHRFSTRSAEEALRVITEEDPVSPSAAVTHAEPREVADRRAETTERLRRRLSGDLDFVVLKALEKDPARRYGSVERLALDLRRHVEGLPVLARGHSTAYLVSRFVRRHRAAVVSASMVVLALFAGLAGTTWQAQRASRQRDLAERRFNDLKSLAHAVMFDIHDAIADLPGSTEAREKLVEHALRYLDGLAREVKDDPALQHEAGIAYAKIADVQGRPMFPNLGRSAEALESYNRAVVLLEAAAAARPDSLAYARDVIVTSQRLADLEKTMGRGPDAMKRALATLSRLDALYGRYPEDPYLPGDLVLIHDRIGDWKLAAADTQGAVAEREFCMNIAEEMFRKNPRDVGWRRSIIINCCKTADLMAARHDREQALSSYRRAERLGLEAVSALGNNTEARRDLSIVYGLTGLFLARGGDIDSGLAVYDLGMKLSERMAAEDPNNALMLADVAAGHFEIGTMLMDGGRYEAAESRFSEAFERYSMLTEADTANVDNRVYLAHCGRQAGGACRELARNSGSAEARTRWRSRAIDWTQKSLDLYVALARLGALSGEDASAPEELTVRLDELKAAR